MNRVILKSFQTAGVLVAFSFTGCVTVSKIDGVPTNSREQKAIREASAVGTAIGAAAGGALGGVIAHSRGASDRQVVASAIGGALGGGAIGRQMGTNTGVKRVGDHRSASERYAKMQNLVKSARQYNSEVGAYNSRLRKRVAEIQRSKSKTEARSEIVAAQAQYNKVDRVIKQRETQSRKLSGSGSYQSTISSLKQQRASIKSSVDRLKRVEGSVG